MATTYLTLADANAACIDLVHQQKAVETQLTDIEAQLVTLRDQHTSLEQQHALLQQQLDDALAQARKLV